MQLVLARLHDSLHLLADSKVDRIPHDIERQHILQVRLCIAKLNILVCDEEKLYYIHSIQVRES